MIFPFGKKAKQKRILKKIHQKQDAMKKLEEEIKTMARLALKDGKLVRTDEPPAPAQPQPQPPMEAPPMPDEYGNETIFDTMPPPPQQPMPVRVPPAPMPRPRGRPPMQQPPQAYQPQQPQAYQQQYYQPPQQPVSVNIQIVMMNGQTFSLSVVQENLDAFLSELTGAIANRTTFIAGKHGINGAHIGWYIISEG